jgi:exopolysaccharide biosynthesis protein
VKRLLSILLFFNLYSLSLLAQSDSLAVVNATWQQKKLAKGVSWKTVHFQQHEIFNSNQYISIIQISPKAKKVQLHMAYSDSLQRTSDLALRHQAIAGVNGSFFKMRGADPDHNANLKDVPKTQPSKIDRNRSVVYLRVRDSLIAENTFAKDSLRRRHQQGVIAIKNDSLSILSTDAKNLLWERTLQANDIVATGPVMLLNGKDQPIPNDAFCNDRHPRTAIGKKADGTVILFVVDGRMQQSIGMSIPELQKIMRWLGCTEAINLDGGGSTAMYIKGQPDNGVVNHPSDNKVFDHKGEREVANVLLLLPIKKHQNKL